MLRHNTPSNWRTLAGVLGVAIFVHWATLQAGSTVKSAEPTPVKHQYKAQIIENAPVGGNRAAALEAALNQTAAEGYEVFDIDRAADGSTLVVFHRTSK